MSGGRNLHGLIFLQRVPRVAKSIPTYILTVATTKAIVIISVILILPNWLYSVVYVLQWISDYYKHILSLSLCQTFEISDYVCAKTPRIHGDIQVRIPVEVRGAVISCELSRDVIFISLSNSCNKRNYKSDGNSTCSPMYS